VVLRERSRDVIQRVHPQEDAQPDVV
jgi:hypothetical protein